MAGNNIDPVLEIRIEFEFEAEVEFGIGIHNSVLEFVDNNFDSPAFGVGNMLLLAALFYISDSFQCYPDSHTHN